VIGFKNKTVISVLAAFAVGIFVGNLPTALATSAKSSNLAKKTFIVSINEVKQNFVFADEFSGTYTKSVTLSDGTQRQIELTPMIHDGMPVVRLKDTGGLTYMTLNGTTTNGKLMIQIEDKEASLAALKAQGWK
jgi:beta-glucanase (GH16 family)